MYEKSNNKNQVNIAKDAVKRFTKDSTSWIYNIRGTNLSQTVKTDDLMF